MQDESDPYSQKLACISLSKMILSWGGISVDFSSVIPTSNKPPKKGTAFISSEPKLPIFGFDQFIYDTIVPLIIQIPTKPGKLHLI